MTQEELKRFEDMAERIMQNADKQQKEYGLRNLCKRIRQTEPGLFDIADGCGDAPNTTYQSFDHRKWHSVNYTNPSYYIEAEAFFDRYEADTEAEHQEREKERQNWKQYQIPKYKVEKRTISIVVVNNHSDNHMQGNKVEEEKSFDERWQYADNGGYYSFWRENRNQYEYLLYRALLRAGYGRIKDANIVEELRRGYIGSAAATAGYTTIVRNAEDELGNAVLAVYLWQALNNESKALQEECELYGLPLVSDQPVPQQTTTAAPTRPASPRTTPRKLTDEERQKLIMLMPFFKALAEHEPIAISGKKGKQPLLTMGDIGSWKFCTVDLCAYVGNKMSAYIDSGRGYAFMQSLTGIDNKKLSAAYSRSDFNPKGMQIVDELLKKIDGE
jgi:hypothetical protein